MLYILFISPLHIHFSDYFQWVSTKRDIVRCCGALPHSTCRCYH